jgi:molecular chaperone DnaK
VLKGEVKDVLLLDVTPLSLGIETLGGVFTKLIDKNTTIPTRRSQVFSTAADNQPAVSIHVLQGEREMVSGNKTLGRFELVGIPPAPRGVPQIEVTFDIDANGIVHVSAKDLGTGKEQSIQITASSGLSEEFFLNDTAAAEIYAADDKARRELVELKNHADQLIYSTEKSLADLGDKIEGSTRAEVESAVAELRGILDQGDKAAIEAKMKALTTLSHKLAETMYAQASSQAAGGGPDQQNEGPPQDDNVVDADFEEVKDEGK